MENNVQLHHVAGKNGKATPDINVSSKGSKVRETLDFTDILGEDGKWQRKIFYMTLVCGITMSWNHLGISFLAYPVEYWCARPQGPNVSLYSWKNQFLPNITYRSDVSNSQCEVQAYNLTIDGKINFLNETEKCKFWEYSNEYYSIVEEWNLVCEKTWMLSMSQSIYMFGFLVAVSLTGQMSDLFGRRPTIILNVLILLTASTATAFSTSFTMFVILRSFVAVGQAGMDLAVFVLVMEVFGPSCRATYAILQSFSFCLGYMLLPLIAWLLSDWFYLQLVFALTSLCYINFFWCLPESPRWLLSKGYTKRALSVMKLAAKENGIEVHNIEDHVARIYCLEKKRKESEKNATILDLFKTPNLRKKTLYLFFIWITLAFTYYGLSFYSTELYGNKFLNFFLSALVEVPTSIYCLLTANRYGRKRIVFLSLIIGGFSCLGFIIIPEGYEIGQNILAISGKLFVSAAFCIIYLFSAEIFPTVARNAGIGVCSMVARIGSALSPFMRDLGQATNPSVPLVMFGILCVISSLFLLKLPETNLQPIPETLTEAEAAVQDSSEEKKT